MSMYDNPLATRYASPAMVANFSESRRVRVWRKLWCALADAEEKLGLSAVTREQVEELEKHIADADLNRAHQIEEETHHDVVAHIRHYAEQCPTAAPIIHLGATSCYITDNADIILMRTAAKSIEKRLANVLLKLREFGLKYKDTVTLAYTHFQPAQPTTVGKRAAMWAYDFRLDLTNLQFQIERLHLLGCRGATGTCDSFLKLFDGDGEKVEKLEDLILEYLGLEQAGTVAVSGQTYTRKCDFYLLQTLSGIAQSASKMATDIRLLSGHGELWEPFGKGQVGSSAMPYKRNPMLCERVCGLSRYIICSAQNAAITAATQWLERTLDDSSNRRLVIPEMFMATDAVLGTIEDVVDGLVVDENRISSRLEQESSHSIMETALMQGVKKGGDRQKLHEKLRRYALTMRGADLISAVSSDQDFGPIEPTSMCGLAEEQTEEFFNAWS